jgi:CheY-like chemotaxis protein
LRSFVATTLSAFDLLVATTDAEALAAIEGMAPDVVLLEANHGEHGTERMCRTIRRGWHDGPPLLVMLPSDGLLDPIVYYEAGADDVVRTPVSPIELQAKCRTLASLRRETELSRLKTQVLDMFAHELRTPLTGILLATESLGAKHGSDSEDRNWFDLLSECTRRLELLADHGVLLCKLRADMLDIALCQCDITALVRKVAAAEEPAAKAHRVAISLQVAEQVLAHVDPHYFEVLLRFLIKGILRWCRPDSTLFLSLDADDEGARLSLSAWTLPAMDKGGGLCSDFVPHTAGGQLVGGHFGFSLVSELLEAQGGAFELVATKTDDLWITCHMRRKEPERRRAERFVMHDAVKLTVLSPVGISVRDMSETGCQAEMEEALKVEFRTASGEPVTGSVVRVAQQNGRLRFGIEFDTPLPTGITAAWVSSRNPSSIRD